MPETAIPSRTDRVDRPCNFGARLMKKFIAAILCAVFAITATTAQANPLWRVTEIYAGISGEDGTNDWFELTNVGSMPGDTGTLFYDDESADILEAGQLDSFILAPGESAKTLEKIQGIWGSTIADYPLDYRFLDEEIDNFYKEDRYFANMFSMFSILAIVVSCLGLIGLVSFSTKRRSKEIGVRKVLGASVLKILKLISLDMVKLISIGAVLAVPIGYFAMNRWLENFEYRTDIAWWVFAVALLLTVLISWLSVSYISYRAANANPVDSLRSE